MSADSDPDAALDRLAEEFVDRTRGGEHPSISEYVRLHPEHEQDIRETLSRVLVDQAGYDVRVAATGFQAGIECERFRPHVLLLDLHIDEHAVSNVIDTVRNSDDLAITRIIAMSGKLTDGQAMGLRSQGFDGFLKKPFAVRQVIEAIEHATALVS